MRRVTVAISCLLCSAALPGCIVYRDPAMPASDDLARIKSTAQASLRVGMSLEEANETMIKLGCVESKPCWIKTPHGPMAIPDTEHYRKMLQSVRISTQQAGPESELPDTTRRYYALRNRATFGFDPLQSIDPDEQRLCVLVFDDLTNSLRQARIWATIGTRDITNVAPNSNTPIYRIREAFVKYATKTGDDGVQLEADLLGNEIAFGKQIYQLPLTHLEVPLD